MCIRDRVCAVRGIRHNDLRALLIAARGVVRFDQQHACKFAVRAGGGLEGHRIHSGDLAQILFRPGKHLKTALHCFIRLQRMDL